MFIWPSLAAMCRGVHCLREKHVIANATGCIPSISDCYYCRCRLSEFLLIYYGILSSVD